MKAIKRRLAIILAALLMVPVQPALAAEQLLPEVTEVREAGESGGENKKAGQEESDDVAGQDSERTGEEVRGDDLEEGAASEEEGTSKEDAVSEEETASEEEEVSEEKTASEEREISGEETASEEDRVSREETESEEKEVVEKETASEEGEVSEKETASEGGEISRKETPSDEKAVSEKEGLSEIDEGSENEEEPFEEELLDDDDLWMKDVSLATEANAKKAIVRSEEGILFNTGNHVYQVVSREDFFDNEMGDAFFEEDGSYTINIPEMNPFFPYEVEFTYEGKKVREWFMTPDDCVEIGGHAFYVSACFDGTVVTQMSLKVAGDTVVVYPEEKEFTDEEQGEVSPLSLLPLDHRTYNIDLVGYTPAELTMVSLDKIFTGEKVLQDTDKIAWTKQGEENFTISSPGDKIDLSYETSYGYGLFNTHIIEWDMIVGDADQLNKDNFRYDFCIYVTNSRNWINAELYTQDSSGVRTNIELLGNDVEYQDSYGCERELNIWAHSDQLRENRTAYVGLDINNTVFSDMEYADLKVYEGKFTSAKEALSGTDITDKIFGVEMNNTDAGYQIELYEDLWITIVTFDTTGQPTGCLPFMLYLGRKNTENHVSSGNLFTVSGDNNIIYITDRQQNRKRDKYNEVTYTLYKGYKAEEVYYLKLSYYTEGKYNASKVTAAYVGNYSSIEESVRAGGVNIKDELFGNSKLGFQADYSKGVDFTIFVGEDSTENQEVYHYKVKAVEGMREPPLSSNTSVQFLGVVDENGKNIEARVLETNKDSYAEGCYITILVGRNVKLTKLALKFYANDLNLYAEDSSSPEVSGKSYHDYSQGVVQFTASAENGIGSRNYWVQVVPAGIEGGKLYVNSLADKEAKTRVENGITYSIREMYLDGRYNYVHDILLVNIGEEELPALSAELVSEEVVLDDYWSLTGNSSFMGIDTSPVTEEYFYLSYGNLWNQAKLRIRAREGMADGRDITGTLTIKSGENILMVLTLTGTVGDPSITTKEIPQAVKYVPYGTMIQNNNKYQWNTVSYSYIGGTLPGGMEIRPNGELYGVPTETGTFTFTVRMDNSYDDFSSSERTFTLTVIENTDGNVESATDQGYYLTERIQNISMNSNQDQTMVSEGVFDEFVDLFLDGEKLVKGVDYDAESGSTRITIRGQTLKKSNTPGKHTLGIEFRTKDTNTLKRAAQNYEITKKSGGSSSGGSGGSSSSGNTSSSGSAKASVTSDAKKGQMNSQTGIITGAGAGYAHWQQNEAGWQLIYADGTMAKGHMAEQSDGTVVEQILWELINGRWYAFGADGNLKSGWVFDYALSGWYLVSSENGMQSGWYQDPTDGYYYYLEPVTGKIAAGWKEIDRKWYYFNEIILQSTWNYDVKTGSWYYDTRSKNKPYGAMYSDEMTPDRYFVGKDGVWDGQEKNN